MDFGHGFYAGSQQSVALGWLGVVEEAREGVARVFHWHLAGNVAHHEEGRAEDFRVGFVAVQGSDGHLRCGCDGFHGAILDGYLHFNIGILSRIDGLFGGFAAQHELCGLGRGCLRRCGFASDFGWEDYRLCRIAAFRGFGFADGHICDIFKMFNEPSAEVGM